MPGERVGDACLERFRHEYVVAAIMSHGRAEVETGATVGGPSCAIFGRIMYEDEGTGGPKWVTCKVEGAVDVFVSRK